MMKKKSQIDYRSAAKMAFSGAGPGRFVAPLSKNISYEVVFLLLNKMKPLLYASYQ